MDMVALSAWVPGQLVQKWQRGLEPPPSSVQMNGLKCGSLEGCTGDPGTMEGPLAAWSFLPSLACQGPVHWLSTP
ncbi:hypothetical protein LEMLEM_LOCUS25752 [Lemmus lemmus]